MKDYNIYYYNMDDKPQYRKAKLVIFGLRQYQADLSLKSINKPLIEQILAIVSHSATTKHNRINIDVCHDLQINPKLKNLKGDFSIKQYYGTSYINTPDIMGTKKVIIYDKATKNTLPAPLYRVEANFEIHNPKDLYIPLEDIYRDVIVPINNHLIIDQALKVS